MADFRGFSKLARALRSMGQAAAEAVPKLKDQGKDMTMNQSNFFSGRILAAVAALVLSTTMVLSSVGPAYNTQSGQSAQGYIA